LEAPIKPPLPFQPALQPTSPLAALQRKSAASAALKKKFHLNVQKIPQMSAPPVFCPPKPPIPQAMAPRSPGAFLPAQRKTPRQMPGVVQQLPLKRTAPQEEVINVETDDFPKFKGAVLVLIRQNEELVYVIFDELIAAIGWDPALRVRHRQHIDFLQDLMVQVERAQASRAELLAEEEEQSRQRQQKRQQAEARSIERRKDQLRSKYGMIPKLVLDQVLLVSLDGAILEILKNIYTHKPDSQRQSWANLVLQYRTVNKSVLRRLIASTVLTAPLCTTILKNSGHYGEDEVAECETAIQNRGAGAGQVPSSIAVDDLIGFILGGATAATLTWLYHAPDRNTAAMVGKIKLLTLTKGDVQRIGACPHIVLDVCCAAIHPLRTLSLADVGALDLAVTMLAGAPGVHISAVLIGTLVGHLTGLGGMDDNQKATYASGCILYPNLSADIIENIVTRNGAYTVQTLRVFNAKVFNCPLALSWAVRNDLAHAIYAPSGAGAWDFFHEIIDDMLGWRGANASHGCFTFAEIIEARNRATGSPGLGPAPDFNEDFTLYVNIVNVRIVLNRLQRRVITMYRV
jgi:hypothetical protein